MKHHHNEEFINRIGQLFGLAKDKAKLIRWNSNLIYDCGEKILRLTFTEIRKESDIENEVNWISYLDNQGIQIVEMEQSIRGNYYEKFARDTKEYIVVCFKKIIGEKVSKSKWNAKHFFKLGKMTGRLHKISRSYPSTKTNVYKNWDKLIEHNCTKYFPEDENKLKQLFQNVVTRINTFPKTEDNYGLVHYDIHHGNYLINNQDQLILFDFEMVCQSWFINDASTVFYYANHFPKETSNTEFESLFMQNFWKGYKEENTIDETEKEWIPTFLLYRDLMVFAYVSNVWSGLELSDTQTKYKNRLQESIRTRRTYLNF